MLHLTPLDDRMGRGVSFSENCGGICLLGGGEALFGRSCRAPPARARRGKTSCLSTHRHPRQGPSMQRLGAAARARRGRRRDGESSTLSLMEVLYGVHPVEEAVKAGRRRFDQVLVARERQDETAGAACCAVPRGRRPRAPGNARAVDADGPDRGPPGRGGFGARAGVLYHRGPV